jgi:hypothetical protein
VRVPEKTKPGKSRAGGEAEQVSAQTICTNVVGTVSSEAVCTNVVGTVSSEAVCTNMVGTVSSEAVSTNVVGTVSSEAVCANVVGTISSNNDGCRGRVYQVGVVIAWKAWKLWRSESAGSQNREGQAEDQF